MDKKLMKYMYTATIDITTTCNLRCKHCRVEETTYTMNLDEIEIICKKLSEYKTKMLFVSGGEPLIRKDIVEVVRIIKRYIPLITINTNATLLTEHLLEKLIDAGVNYIQVSLDGLEKSHNKIRGEGTFQKTFSNLKLLAKYNDKISVHVSCVISKINLDYMEEFVNFLINKSKLPIKIIGFKRYLPKNVMAGVCNLGKEGYSILDKKVDMLAKKYDGIVSIVMDSPIKNINRKNEVLSIIDKYKLACAGCSAVTGGLAIRANGDVSPCSLLDVRIGNILSDSIESLYSSVMVNDLINRKLSGKCGICEYKIICGGCRAAAYLSTGDCLSEDPECYI